MPRRSASKKAGNAAAEVPTRPGREGGRERPPLKKKPAKKRSIRPGNCFNCGCDETQTTLWRTDPGCSTCQLCNACGIYRTFHGEHRPVHLFDSAKTRRTEVEGEHRSPSPTVSTPPATSLSPVSVLMEIFSDGSDVPNSPGHVADDLMKGAMALLTLSGKWSPHNV
nr:hypothetical protein L203_03878 [Cryptococcus depauperatus CBS 7841]ODO04390.1 hypothetical protein L204_00749 [Cryptococcus depauperatus CBS 7855]